MKNRLFRLCAVLLATVLIACTMSVSAFAEEAEGGDIVVLYTNDVHCSIDNYAVLAAYRAQLISEGHTVITVDIGDAIQGEVIGALTEGSAIVDIMNKVGYDYAALGNHEFDYTVETIIDLAENEAQFEYLCSNFRYLPEDRDIFTPYAIEEMGGIKVAFVGISTPETYSKSTPTYFQDENGNFIYSFMQDSFYETVQSAVDGAIADGADVVVAMGHLGMEGVTEGWRSSDVIANTTGIDVLLDAHAHQVIEGDYYENKDGETVLLSSTGSKFANFGVLTVSPDGSHSSTLINPEDVDIDALSADAQTVYNTVKTVIDDYNAEFEYLFEEIGTSDAYLTEYDADGNWIIRSDETNLGNFVTDAYIAETGADIAFVNGGGVRAEVQKGVVTRKAIMDINPWSNELCVLRVSGQQILDALEYGVKAMPEAYGSFPHVAGISFEVHTYIESAVVVNENDEFVSIPDGAERRIANVKVGDEAIDVDKMYTLAGSCYMLQLSGYKMFDGAEVVTSPEELPTDMECLVKYFTETLGGNISAEQYGDISGDGRITVISEKPAIPDDGEQSPATGDINTTAVWLTVVALALACSALVGKKRVSR